MTEVQMIVGDSGIIDLLIYPQKRNRDNRNSINSKSSTIRQVTIDNNFVIDFLKNSIANPITDYSKQSQNIKSDNNRIQKLERELEYFKAQVKNLDNKLEVIGMEELINEKKQTRK
ncbi:hypothetical protein Glove_21g381 [Diversispora epigaea]|uniref:Uncharacterized protein n=1 Tax=Diversispora epigaea TaxID=1348612 RepID=A0A397JPW6_9GLOM|nr:hypothetical protein Glove_21g381 [Diversispora epigaea]